MYERSAIVLERYMENILEFNKKYNLKNNYTVFSELIIEVEQYLEVATKEGKIIEEFDDTAKRIQDIQNIQDKLYKANTKLEENRKRLFEDLGEDARTLDSKLKRIENTLERNNEKQKDLREEFTKYLTDFSQRQKERNKCAKARRLSEADHMNYLKKVVTEFQSIDKEDIENMKDFINSEKALVKDDVNEIMLKNGKNEKIGFNKDVLRKAIQTRVNIAEREAKCYIVIYDKMKKLLQDLENDNFKIEKYKKIVDSTDVNLAFLNAEKEYIFGFLDYERMTAINGTKAHKKLMEDACKNFELDIIQINNLYELILKEIDKKATKKMYKELFNKTYLRNIEEKEKNFEKEVNTVQNRMGTIINFNYWRIEGLKNIYTVFQNEISEKFEKNIADLQIEEYDELEDYNRKIRADIAETQNLELLLERYKSEKEEYFGPEEDDELEDDDYEIDEDEEDEDEEFNEYLEEEDDSYNEYMDIDEDDEDGYELDDENIDDDFEEDEEIKPKSKKMTKKNDKKEKAESVSKKQNSGLFNGLFKDKKEKKGKHHKK